MTYGEFPLAHCWDLITLSEISGKNYEQKLEKLTDNLKKCSISSS